MDNKGVTSIRRIRPPRQAASTFSDTSCCSSDDDDTACAVAAPAPFLDPQRQQMQKELAAFQMHLVADGQRDDDVVSEGQELSIRELPATVTTTKKTKNKKKRHKKKIEHRHGRSNSLVSVSDLDETLLPLPTPDENLAGFFPDRAPDPNPMLSHMLRRMDLAGVWHDEEEERERRGPDEMEPVMVAIEVGGR